MDALSATTDTTAATTTDAVLPVQGVPYDVTAVTVETVPVWLSEYLHRHPELDGHIEDLYHVDGLSEHELVLAVNRTKQKLGGKHKKSWGRKLRKCLGITLTLVLMATLATSILTVFGR